MSSIHINHAPHIGRTRRHVSRPTCSGRSLVRRPVTSWTLHDEWTAVAAWGIPEYRGPARRWIETDALRVSLVHHSAHNTFSIISIGLTLSCWLGMCCIWYRSIHQILQNAFFKFSNVSAAITSRFPQRQGSTLMHPLALNTQRSGEC